MAMETVQAIRQAELNAAGIEKDSNKKKDEILLSATNEREAIIGSMTKEAHDKSANDLEQAKTQSKERLEKAIDQAEKEIILLREMAKAKEEAAIKLVLDEVI